MAKEKDTRIKFKLSSFYRDNLKLENKKLYFGNGIYLHELCTFLKIDQKKTMRLLNLEDDCLLTSDQIAEVCLNHNLEFEHINSISPLNVLTNIIKVLAKHKFDIHVKEIVKTPVVTIMGHVDHGKTTLLDTIRKSRVAMKEVGGITQKIGAYQISHKDKPITFIDTPGHEAFTKMRAHGSKITDIAVIVVAADDAVMPQTKESIEHAQNAGVPIIVAINKIDKPGVDIERIKHQLTDLKLTPEEWGGSTQYVPLSAKTGEGIDKLLDVISLVYEMKPTKVYENIIAAGVILESGFNKQTGNTATILVENGTLHVGDTIIIGDSLIKIKVLINDQGKRIEKAIPGTPVEIFGIGCSPEVGSKFVVVEDEKEASKVLQIIKDYKKLAKTKNIKDVSMEDLFLQATATDTKKLNIILKADGNGVLEAIAGKLEYLSTPEFELNIIRKDVGEITTSDLHLAEVSGASFYTFALKTNDQIKKQAENKSIPIYEFDIIYKLIEDLEEKIKGSKTKKYVEKKTGEIEVRQVFTSSKFGSIAGCIVKSGTVNQKSIISVTRKGQEIFKGKVSSLKHQKENVKDRKEGQECGIVLDGFDKYQADDIFIAFELVEE